MKFNLIYKLLFKGAALFGHTKSAISHMTAGPPGNLGHFCRTELTYPLPVKFGIFCQCHMVDIHIQTHANRICGDHEINITILIQLNLSIAGTGAERAHHNGRPAALAPDQLRQTINIRG